MTDPACIPQEKLADAAFLAKALSDANRLRILCCLGRGERSVNQIAEALDLSQPLVSHHLKELKRALLVRVERRGPFIFYTLTSEEILSILCALSALAQALLAEKKSF
ncbi:ArsR/SmtB-type metalloregulator TsoR [Desulfonatronum sp. SC1]|uniref:ArsR/SmtB-type metalloregulator TsoR n=1 Tax=Desulfonatronum sp. SC1 TaxID=2109626 RepID=UPI000D318048|nr:metalloregulator ArsR/SmtB family transcription factor [Desulfonatronum sp. SC1]PTN36350.1 transcriptional regulator [Desulfonatronum sp. SC1]